MARPRRPCAERRRRPRRHRAAAARPRRRLAHGRELPASRAACPQRRTARSPTAWNDDRRARAPRRRRVGARAGARPVRPRAGDGRRGRATAGDAAPARATAISYAAYRLLVWRASLQSNLAQTLRAPHRAAARALPLAASRDAGGSPAAAGNRVAAAAIAAGAHDGSNEQLHYADPSYTPRTRRSSSRSRARPCTTRRSGSRSQRSSHRRAALRRRAVGPRAHVLARRRAAARAVTAARRSVERAYERAAPTCCDATTSVMQPPSTPRRSPGTRSQPLHAPGRVAADLRLYRLLNGALNDAAVVTWRAKRTTQAPRPISMIRYLAFEGRLPPASRHGSVWLPLARQRPPRRAGAAEAAAFAVTPADTVLDRAHAAIRSPSRADAARAHSAVQRRDRLPGRRARRERAIGRARRPAALLRSRL